MVNIRQVGQTRTIRRFVWGSFALVIALLSGCTHSPALTNQAPKGDPLFPLPPAPAFPNQPGGVTPTQPTAFNTGGVPAIPALHSPTNNATLASLSGQAPISNTLAINASTGWTRTPGQLTNDQKPTPTPVTPGFIPPNPSPKVEPVPDVGSPGQSITPTVSWQSSGSSPSPPPPPASPPTTDETLAKRLQERGVINQKQDQTPDGLRLTCYASRGPTGLRIYEVTAADYASAALAILQQLESQ